MLLLRHELGRFDHRFQGAGRCFGFHSIGRLRYCDGVSRRNFLQVGVAGMATAGLGSVLQARAQAAEAGSSGKDTSVILLWLDGGPSHMDLYDLKPLAPAESRGIWSPIPTNVPGIEISELFPLQAKIADKFSLVRSLHHDTGDHFAAAHRILTGRDAGVSGGATAGKYPFFGAAATAVTGPRHPRMPEYVGIPYGMSVGLRPGYFGGNYLGVEHNPFETEGDPNAANFQVQNISLAGELTIDRLSDRRLLQTSFDALHRDGRRQRSGRGDEPVRSAGLRTGDQRRSPQGVRHLSGGRCRPRFVRPAQLGTECPAGSAAGRSRHDVRHVPLRRLGSSLGSQERHGELSADRRPGRQRADQRPRSARPVGEGAASCCAASSHARRA